MRNGQNHNYVGYGSPESQLIPTVAGCQLRVSIPLLVPLCPVRVQQGMHKEIQPAGTALGLGHTTCS